MFLLGLLCHHRWVANCTHALRRTCKVQNCLLKRFDDPIWPTAFLFDLRLTFRWCVDEIFNYKTVFFFKFLCCTLKKNIVVRCQLTNTWWRFCVVYDEIPQQKINRYAEDIFPNLRCFSWRDPKKKSDFDICIVIICQIVRIILDFEVH